MSSFMLKMIALTTMLIDHFGSTISTKYTMETINIYTMCRAIGRISFPIYVFLVAESARKTRDIKKYCLRLFIFALISEFPFDLLFSNDSRQITSFSQLRLLNTAHQNVFFTLFLGVLAIYTYNTIMEKYSNIFLSILPVSGIIYLGEFLLTDYGSLGIASIFLVYLAKDRLIQIFVLTIMLFINNFGIFDFYPILSIMLLFGASLSLVFIYFYNGEKGYSMKWFFYLAYPLHLILLFFIWFFVILGNKI